MKNLKKVLALVLAFACAFTMFAGAAFTDQADIETADAVDTLVALGVIDGYEDGSFRPDDTVTRAEMAKMIYTVRTGRSDASAYNDDATSFTDITNHWARGYIKYCQSLGVISGKSVTSFDPDADVTTQEAAKMLLVTLGYNAEIAGLEGSGWAQKTTALADENGLLEAVNCGTTQGMPRQYAAQLIYNAVNAYTVVYRDGAYTNWTANGDEQLPTIGERYMGLIRTTVTVYGDQARNPSLLDGQMEVILENGTTHCIITYSVENITDMIGQQVELLWKESNDSKNKLDKNDKIYGMYTSRGTSVIEATVSDIADDFNTANKVKINDTEYEFASGAQIYTNLGNTGTTANKTNVEALNTKTGDTIRVLLNDSNKITAIYVTTSDLYKVTAVSGTKVSLAGIGTIDTAENNTTVYDGIAKDDVVAVTKLYKDAAADATFVIEKAESVSGTVTAYATDKSTVTLDDTVYSIYGETDMKENLTDDDVKAFTTDDLDDEFTLYLVNGYVRAAQKGSDDMNNYAVVTDFNTGILDSTFNEPKAELLFADGSKQTVVLHKDSILYTNSDSTQANHNNTKFDTSKSIDTALVKGEIVKYAEMSNGQYKIEEAVKGDTYYNSSTREVYNSDTKTFSDVVTSGDCPLFYTDSTGAYKVANIRSLDDINITAKQYAYAVDDGKVVAAFINLQDKPGGASDDTLYGIVTTGGQSTNKGDDPYTLFHIWTGEDTLVYVDDAASKLSKGTLVSFDKSADDTYSEDDFTVLTDKAVAVTDYSEEDQNITYAKTLKVEGNAFVENGVETKYIDEDAKIVYIDAKNDAAGDSGMGIEDFDATTGYANALLVLDKTDTKKVLAIIVNTNNDVDVLGNKTVASAFSITCAAVDPLATNYASSAATGSYVAGQEVKITVTAKASGTISAGTEYTLTFAADASAIVDGLEAGNTTVKATATEDGSVTFTMTAKGAGTLTVSNFA